MAFRRLAVGPVRGLAQAAARDLPNLVVIAGPNGAGKSTLLEALQRETSIPEPGTQVLWLGPHRGLDQVGVDRSALAGQPEPVRESIEHRVTPGMQVGWQLGTIVKTYLVQLLARQRIARDQTIEQFDPQQSFTRLDLPDLFAPFRDLVAILLPHLSFQGVVEDAESNRVSACSRPLAVPVRRSTSKFCLRARRPPSRSSCRSSKPAPGSTRGRTGHHLCRSPC
jgi:hypothetical protein